MSPKSPKHHRPEDNPEPGTPGTGEDTCPDCHGTRKQVDKAGDNEQGSFLSLALTKNDHWLPGGPGESPALPSATAI